MGNGTLRGFAWLKANDPKRQKEIASQGGKTAHKMGLAHEWNKREARKAGRKGGTISRGGRGKLAKGSTARG